MKVDNIFYGMTGVDLKIGFLSTLCQESDTELFNGSGTVSVVSNSGVIAAHSDSPELVGKNLNNTHNEDMSNIQKVQSILDPDTITNEYKCITLINIGQTTTPWAIIITMPQDVILADALKMVSQMKQEAYNSIIWQIGVGIGITCGGISLM